MKKIKAYVGIDPGQYGAAALIDTYGTISYFDWEDATKSAAKIKEWIKEYNVELAILERVSAMPKQGLSSTFKFGTNFGIWLGILASLDVPHKLVRPQEWQKGLISKNDGPDAKARSLTVARRLFPSAPLSRKKDNGRADALLIAEYAKRQKK